MRRFRSLRLPAPGERIQLDPEASHHALHVLRLATGTEIGLFDGDGTEVIAGLVATDGGIATVVGTDRLPRRAPRHPLHLLLGIPRPPAMDLALRMATEVGVTDVHPCLTRNAVKRADKAARWARIGSEAARQCGRADVPTIHPLASLGEAFARLPADLDRRVACPGAQRRPPAVGPAAVLVGPEGGLTPKELELAFAADFQALGLGDWILRSPTATAVALAITAA